jgi:hypothetical protein
VSVSIFAEQQKEKLQAALAEKREKVGEFLKTNPAKTKAEILAKVKEQRAEIHERIAAFLSPEQLSEWDSEVAKAKEFLGQRLDSQERGLPRVLVNWWPPASAGGHPKHVSASPTARRPL